MDQWFVPPKQLALVNKTVKKYGHDLTGRVDYHFNQYGFRGPELVKEKSIFFIGGTICFGLGIRQQEIFADMLSKTLALPYANFSFGEYRHENHDHLTNLSKLANRSQNDIFVIQINNLDRRRVSSELVVDNNHSEYCKKRFFEYFDLVNDMLKNKQKLFIHWDNIEHNLPNSITKQILISNQFHLDSSLPDQPNTFGPASHKAIYKILLAKIRQLN